MIHQLRINKTIVIDFQEKSPERLAIQKFQDNPNITLWGKRSVGVPGLVAGLHHAQQQYGSNSKVSSNSISGAGNLPPNGRKRTATGTKRVNLNSASFVNMKFGPAG